jgi:ribonuclease PH
MLPCATYTRNKREAVTGRQGGRTTEIQRLIGRALRTAVDRRALGERQIIIDCDVIAADGGTRCAAITGGWVALKMACDGLLRAGTVASQPVAGQVAAVSCGVYAGVPVLDLDYAEDSQAGVDGNFVLLDPDRLVEVQTTAEGGTFDREVLERLLNLGILGCRQLFAMQASAVGG